MLPIRDNIPPRSTPFVNYGVIWICAVVFFLQLNEDPGKGSLVERYGMIPARVLHPDQPVEMKLREYVRTRQGTEIREYTQRAAEAAVPVWLTAFTCIFLHGGWLHFLGNMWFLYIFGDNVADRFGHVGYVLFYVGCGVAASVAHLLSGPESTLPTIGASGAIAGVMGAYLLLYPKAMVQCLVPLGFIWQIMVLPASIFLGIWFLIQFFQGTFAIGSTQAGGVAWWAHIGGFVVGAGVAFGLDRSGVLKPKVEAVRPHSDHVGMYRVSPRNRRGW